MKLATERLQELEQKDLAQNRRLLMVNVWYIIKEQFASWAFMKLLEEYNRLESLKRANKIVSPLFTCFLVERFGLPCYNDLERAYGEALSLPLTLIHSRWWNVADIKTRAGWRPSYGVQSIVQRSLQLNRPSHEIVDTTNELSQYREGLSSERQQRLDEAHVQATRAILRDAQRHEAANLLVPPMLLPPVQSTWNLYAKSHDKASKRMMMGAEAAERDANAAEAIQNRAMKEKEAQEQIQLTVEETETTMAAVEAVIDDELLASDSESSEINEVIFATPVSPLVRPSTPDISRKRTLTLVMRTPDAPRAAPVAPTPPEAHEIPASTAPARLDGRRRREGKNSEYIRAMAIERGRGRGGRGRV